MKATGETGVSLVGEDGVMDRDGAFDALRTGGVAAAATWVVVAALALVATPVSAACSSKHSDPEVGTLEGSPLDDLDEALRSAAAGGVGSFFGRRRLRKIGAQQATLGWRTIIGKISAAVDWRGTVLRVSTREQPHRSSLS